MTGGTPILANLHSSSSGWFWQRIQSFQKHPGIHVVPFHLHIFINLQWHWKLVRKIESFPILSDIFVDKWGDSINAGTPKSSIILMDFPREINPPAFGGSPIYGNPSIHIPILNVYFIYVPCMYIYIYILQYIPIYSHSSCLFILYIPIYIYNIHC